MKEIMRHNTVFDRLIILSIFVAFSHNAAAASSAENRSQYRVLLLAEPISFTPYPGGGIRASLLIADNISLEAAYTSSKSNFDGGSSRFIYNQLDFLGRIFIGNSFNLSGGLGHQRLRINYEEGGYDNEQYEGVRVTTGTMGLYFSLGNQWQLARFTIGCDWAGFFIPVARTFENMDTDSDIDTATRMEVEDDYDKASNQFRELFLRFHIGIAI